MSRSLLTGKSSEYIELRATPPCHCPSNLSGMSTGNRSKKETTYDQRPPMAERISTAWISDGIEEGQGKGPNKTASNPVWVFAEEYFKQQIGKEMSKDDPARYPGQSYVADNIPPGYSAWWSKRVGNKKSTEYRIFGHPSGKVFHSWLGFFVHFRYVQKHEDWEPCCCKLCKERDFKVDTTVSDTDPRVHRILDALLQLYWTQLVAMPYRALDNQRKALAEEGLRYSAVAPVVVRYSDIRSKHPADLRAGSDLVEVRPRHEELGS